MGSRRRRDGRPWPPWWPPIFKLKGHYLRWATLGLGIILNIAIRNEATWTGGPRRHAGAGLGPVRLQS